MADRVRRQTQGLTCGEFPRCAFCFKYLRPGAQKAGNPETPTDGWTDGVSG